MPDHKAILPQHIDSTMMSCFRSCPRKFFLEFCFGLRPPGVSIDLHAGGCFATAIETVYREVWLNNRSLEDALLRAHAAFWLAWGDFQIPEYKVTAKTGDRMWEAVEYYFSKFPPRTDHIQPYFASDGRPTFEYSFAIPLEPTYDGHSDDEMINGFDSGCFPKHPSGEPFLYSGRVDMLGRMGAQTVVRDEKTLGRSFGSDWAQLWNLRGQFIGYTWAMQSLGIECETVVARGVSILKTQLDIQEAVKTYSRFIIDRWHDQLRRDLWRLRRAWDEQYFDFNLGETCTSYGKPCIFHNSCESATPEMWFSDFEVRRWNPLTRSKIEEV